MTNHPARRRFSALFLTLLFMMGLSAAGRAQVQNSSPPDQRIEVAQSTANRLYKSLALGGNPSAALSQEAERLLVDLVPESNRKLCGVLVEDWAPRNEPVLTARLLHVGRERDTFSALVAYRCGFRPNPHFDAIFDDRLALLVRNGKGTSLALISPHRPEECCNGQSVELLRVLPLAEGQLLELGVQSVSSGAGPDSSSRYELVWVLDPAGQVALKIDSRTEYDSYEADTEESHESVCEAQVRYEKDETGKLTAIVTETACTEDKVKQPSETARYVWDAAAAHFKHTTSQTKEQAATGR